MRRESSPSLLCPSPAFPQSPLMKRSKSIPIKSGLDCQNLAEQDEEMDVDWRDYVVFHRIATGISKMQQETTGTRTRLVNDMCLASIIGTRNLSDDELMRGGDSSRRRLPRSERPTTTTAVLHRKPDGSSWQAEPSASLKSMLLRSYGRQGDLFYLSSLPEQRRESNRIRPPAAPPSVDDEAIFDLEL